MMTARAAVLGLVFMLATMGSWGADRTPLLQDGKKTLHQRVLTRPGTSLLSLPGGGDGKPIDAFSRFYVYAEREHGGRRWLEVGVDANGTVGGWVDAAQTVPWQQQLAAAFTNPGAERQRALFFESWDSLEALMTLEDPASAVTSLSKKVDSGEQDSRVVAIEPDRHIDINQEFYLLPILGYREHFSDAGHLLRGLKVASVTKTEVPPDATNGSDPKLPAASPPGPDGEVRKLAPFRAAVVFVIDSTISMQQYIDEAREAVNEVYRRIEGSRLLDRVSFGLVAYRARSADPARNAKLEYVARMFVDPAEVASAAEFLGRAGALQEASTTTDHFAEDPYAGVQLALDEIPWHRFGARFLVLITDAGALEGDASTTGLRAEQVRSATAAEDVSLFVLHLKTPQGTGNHATAETQYRTLARNAAIQESLYIPVKTGSVPAYRAAVNALAEAVVQKIEQAADGDTKPPSRPSPIPAETPTDGDDEAARVRRLVERLGYAMQIAYLGRQERTAAPQVFEAWISDRDLVNPTVRVVDARVLLTKDQLSTLHGILQEVLDAANSGLLEPDAFFDHLRSLAAQYTRDPNLAKRPEAKSLADLGLLDEFLEDLPYQSDVMRVDLDTWSRWGAQRQLDFISRVKSKMHLYERYNADADRWISLAEGSPPGEHVYPVPLTDLP